MCDSLDCNISYTNCVIQKHDSLDCIMPNPHNWVMLWSISLSDAIPLCCCAMQMSHHLCVKIALGCIRLLKALEFMISTHVQLRHLPLFTWFIGFVGGANNFCLQKSRMPTGRIGIFNNWVDAWVRSFSDLGHLTFQYIQSLWSLLVLCALPKLCHLKWIPIWAYSNYNDFVVI